MNPIKNLRAILNKDAKPTEVRAAIVQLAAAGFIFTLILGALDTDSTPQVALIAGAIYVSFLVVGLTFLRRAVCGRP